MMKPKTLTFLVISSFCSMYVENNVVQETGLLAAAVLYSLSIECAKDEDNRIKSCLRSYKDTTAVDSKQEKWIKCYVF